MIRITGWSPIKLGGRFKGLGPGVETGNRLAAGVGPGPESLGEAQPYLGRRIAGRYPIDDRPAGHLGPTQNEGGFSCPSSSIDNDELSPTIFQDDVQFGQFSLATNKSLHVALCLSWLL